MLQEHHFTSIKYKLEEENMLIEFHGSISILSKSADGKGQYHKI